MEECVHFLLGADCTLRHLLARIHLLWRGRFREPHDLLGISMVFILRCRTLCLAQDSSLGPLLLEHNASPAAHTTDI